MNILILSSGTRNKVVEYFKRELENKGKIVCTDCNPLAPSIYLADKHYIVPRIDDPNYLDIIKEICVKENIKAMFSLIDPELSLISKHKNEFIDLGVIPFVSDYEQIKMSFDKFDFYEFCSKNNFPTVKSYKDINKFIDDFKLDKIKFPVFVKPITGSCSINIQKIDNLNDLKFNFNKYPDLMIQEFIEGQELGADVFIDMISNEVISIFTKKKLLMRAGETDKSVSFKDKKLFDLIKSFVSKAGFKGQIDIDIFEVNGEYYLSEVNPRFGGGYPHAYECGCNFPNYMIKNMQGDANKPEIGEYEENIYMMKYLDLLIKKN